MDDDDEDPLAFIASIEQSAPQDSEPTKEHRCPDCDVVLEEIEDKFICPSCDTQANILQVEETECFYDEMGRAIVGQGVNIQKKAKKHQVDYGWAWSTDEAIVDILNQQITALENCGLIPDLFRQGVKNMWLKYWVENIAPFIKDQYSETDFVPIEASKILNVRDIEILVKVRDKVVLPKRMRDKSRHSEKVYKMFGSNFYKPLPHNQQDDQINDQMNDQSEYFSDDATNTTGANPSAEDLEQQSQKNSSIHEDEHPSKRVRPTKVGLGLNSICVLTLDRTLAFIEATARCMNLAQPIFASDIVRACCQRVIPFFGAHRTLPEGMNLNERDRMIFRKLRPPNPCQLTKAAALLMHTVYSDKLPKLTPVPCLKRILERFIKDMNLPYDILNHVTDSIGFSNFKQTRPLLLRNVSKNKIVIWPQYDRWAFSILLAKLKKLFSLDEKGVVKESEQAREESRCRGENIFILQDWLRQISIRLNFILSYDSYAIYHPMTDLKNLQPTSQLYSYIDTSLKDRVSSTTRTQRKIKRIDDAFREELTEFVVREIPRPFPGTDFPKGQGLEKPRDITSPIHDAFNRTKRHWMPEICDQPDTLDLIFRDFSCCKLSLPKKPTKWTIYDDGIPRDLHKFEILESWPYWFKLLLSIGGYLCHCQPHELLRELRFVEEYLYPEMRVMLRARLYKK